LPLVAKTKQVTPRPKTHINAKATMLILQKLHEALFVGGAAKAGPFEPLLGVVGMAGYVGGGGTVGR
jgi:hypothetical protein